MNPNIVTFDVKADPATGWPPGFHTYVKEIARIEGFQYIERTPEHVSVILTKQRLVVLQGWLEMKFGRMP